MKWGYYIAAAIMASFFLLKFGAPWYAVLGGVLLVGHWNWRKAARSPRV